MWQAGGMTLSEAIKTGTLRLTQSAWNKYAHIELHPVGDHGFGPWVKLRDVAGRPGGGEQQVSVFGIEQDGWEAWTPPDDVGRFLPRWPTYEAHSSSVAVGEAPADV